MTDYDKLRTDPPLSAYIKVPEGDGPFPVVIVFMHRPGVDNAQEKVVNDLATAGFIGICHDSYRGGSLRDSYTDDTIFEDFEFVLSYVQNMPQADSNQIAAMGFCMGGRHVYLAAARYQLKSVVSYYGFPGQGDDEKSTPMQQVTNMSVPVLGIFGRQDILFPFSDVEKFIDLMASHKANSSKIVVYDDAGHGFLSPFSKKRYAKESATKAWQETLAWYKTYFK